MSERTGLYRLYSANGMLLYVGISGKPRRRMRQHAAAQPWWPDVTRKTVAWYGSREKAETAESIVIGLEHPRYNISKRYVRLQEVDLIEKPAPAPVAPVIEPRSALVERHAWPEMNRLMQELDDMLNEALADEDEVASFRHAESVLKAATGIRGRAAKVKARASLRLWREKDVSLSDLAQRLGISKQRADQLVRKARELDGRGI